RSDRDWSSDVCSSDLSGFPIFQLSFSTCYFQEARFVVRVVGAHEAVQEIEVDAVVAAHFFVVHRVVGGSVEEELQWSLHEPTGKIGRASCRERGEKGV